jgi:Polyketide cyclase / dehydrase and lipid transport
MMIMRRRILRVPQRRRRHGSNGMMLAMVPLMVILLAGSMSILQVGRRQVERVDHCLGLAAVTAFVPSRTSSRRRYPYADYTINSKGRIQHQMSTARSLSSIHVTVRLSSSTTDDEDQISIDQDQPSDKDQTTKSESSPLSIGYSDDSEVTGGSVDDGDYDDSQQQQQRTTGRIRRRVRQLAKNIVSRPLALATTVPVPSAIAAVLREASLAAVEQVEDAIATQQQERRASRSRNKNSNNDNGDEDDESVLSTTDMMESIIDDAFAPMELSLLEMEESLKKARQALQTAKQQSYEAMEALQVAAEAQAQSAAEAVAQVEKAAQRQVMVDIYSSSTSAVTASSSSSTSSYETVDISQLSFEDVDYDSSEMAPPFLDPDSCLVPGEPVIRVEKAPENSRRIFAGIDIMASVDDVWNVLTNYDQLQNVIPNLVVNDVLELYDGVGDGTPLSNLVYDEAAPEEVQCKQLATQMKGSLLKQVGGAKVAGINFSARTTLEVREWPNGMPDFAHFSDDMWDGKSRESRAREYPKIKLKRYRFPRPFALSRLPTRDISMQSIPEDDGEFRMYQGVWRMQPLPGCAPPGKEAMRLTYAVEISPRAYLPVKLVEGRIVKDLTTNLEAIRNAVTKP